MGAGWTWKVEDDVDDHDLCLDRWMGRLLRQATGWGKRHWSSRFFATAIALWRKENEIIFPILLSREFVPLTASKIKINECKEGKGRRTNLDYYRHDFLSIRWCELAINSAA